MFDVNKLDYFMKDRGFNRDTLLKEWGISQTSYYKKRKNPFTFTLKDVDTLKRILKLSNEELASIFLN